MNAADALLANGAKEVYAYITHGVLSGGAAARIASSRLKELVITDSIQPTEAVKKASNIRSLSIAALISEAIPARRRKSRCRACSTELPSRRNRRGAKRQRAHLSCSNPIAARGRWARRNCAFAHLQAHEPWPGRGTKFMIVRVKPPSTMISSPLM